MNSIFYDHMYEFVVVYIDDLLVFSKSREDHLKHLEIVLSLLQENKHFVGRNKCHFMTEEIEILGLTVSERGINIDDSRIKAVQEWPQPKSISGLRFFVWLLQYF